MGPLDTRLVFLRDLDGSRRMGTAFSGIQIVWIAEGAWGQGRIREYRYAGLEGHYQVFQEQSYCSVCCEYAVSDIPDPTFV